MVFLLHEKGFINDKTDAAHELYGYGKDGTHIISEDVQERFKDGIEHELLSGMMEEPEYGVESPRRGRHR